MINILDRSKHDRRSKRISDSSDADIKTQNGIDMLQQRIVNIISFFAFISEQIVLSHTV